MCIGIYIWVREFIFNPYGAYTWREVSDLMDEIMISNVTFVSKHISTNVTHHSSGIKIET